jgi:hypothetical protein
MNREIMQQALDHLVALADDLRRIPSDIAQTIAALEAELVNYEEPLPPVDIGVDVTPEGTHVVACYNRPDAVQEMFYSQFHLLAKPEQASNEPPDYVEPPTSDYHNGWEEGFEAAKNLYPQKTKREWYGLSDKDCDKAWEHAQKSSPYGVTRIEVFAKDIERRLKERNNAV